MRYGLQSQMSNRVRVMDDISEVRLKDVHPILAGKIREMANLLGQQGITIRVIQGVRTWEEQARLYDQGRNPPSGEPIVTDAPPGFSYHNFGLAVDVVPMMPLGPDWNVSHPVWGQIVQMGRSVGLEAGATWRTFKDYPHFQLTGNLPLSPTQEVRAAFASGGVAAVWDLTGYGKPLENSQEQDV
jgi:peptidoglycan L-alanyl-D-glutamate endopeptidase CwlK